MQCSVNGEMLSAFADGELTPSQAAAMRQHLAGCASCRAQLAGLRQVAGLVRSLEEVAPPPDLRARVAERMVQPAAITCTQAGQQLDAMLDGQLPAAQEAAFRAHLAECAGCRERYRLHEEMVSALRTMPMLEPPARLRERVYARQRPQPAWRLQPAWKAVTASVGLATAAAALMLALRTGNLPPSDKPAPARPDQVVATQAPPPPTPAPVAQAAASETPVPVAAVRRSARRVMHFLAGRQITRHRVSGTRQLAKASPADVPATVPHPEAETATAEPVPHAAAADTAVAALPAQDTARVAPPAEPAPAPVIASTQPITSIVQAATQAVTPDYSKEVVRVTRNEPRPVEVKAFKVEF